MAGALEAIKSPLTKGQKGTRELFAAIIYEYGEYLPKMHSEEDRAAESAFFLNDVVSLIKRAYDSGRSDEGWLPRVHEMDATRRAAIRRFHEQYSQTQIKEMVDGELNPIYTKFGWDYSPNRPY